MTEPWGAPSQSSIVRVMVFAEVEYWKQLATALLAIVHEELQELREREWSFLDKDMEAQKGRRECPDCYSWMARGHRDGCEIARRIAQLEAVLSTGTGGNE